MIAHANNPPTPHALSLRPREAAKALGVSTRTLWTWTKAGLIPHLKVGGVVMYRVADLDAWLAQHATTEGGDA